LNKTSGPLVRFTFSLSVPVQLMPEKISEMIYYWSEPPAFRNGPKNLNSETNTRMPMMALSSPDLVQFGIRNTKNPSEVSAPPLDWTAKIS